jgi:hypothetical protein
VLFSDPQGASSVVVLGSALGRSRAPLVDDKGESRNGNKNATKKKRRPKSQRLFFSTLGLSVCVHVWMPRVTFCGPLLSAPCPFLGRASGSARSLCAVIHRFPLLIDLPVAWQQAISALFSCASSLIGPRCRAFFSCSPRRCATVSRWAPLPTPLSRGALIAGLGQRGGVVVVSTSSFCIIIIVCPALCVGRLHGRLAFWWVRC